VIRFIAKRLLLAVPTLLGVLIASFLIIHLIPGDPVAVMMFGANPTPQQLVEMRAELGLDRPLQVQFWDYLRHVMQGDFGQSIQRHRPVGAEIRQNLGPTLMLTLAGMSIAIVVGFALGLVAALRPNSWVDSLCMGVANVGVAIPAFWLGILLILLFALTLGWLPATGQGGGRRLILPAISLGFGYSAIIARLVRSSLVQVLGREYILTARAKGLSERIVLSRHAMRNALIPVITMVGLQFGNMMGSAVVVEVLFARVGLGRLLVTAILQRDYPLIQGTILVFGVVYIFLNLIIDLLYSVVDPRIRYT
jgi:ABC-type dipeptide/oligopeptide/nickel transport system permease component